MADTKKNTPEIRFKGFEGDWEEKKLGEICMVLTGGEPPMDYKKGNKPSADYIYPIYSNGLNDNALWGWAKEYRVSEPAITFSSIGTLGCPTLREKNFTPIIRLKVIIPKEKNIDLSYLCYNLTNSDFSNNAGGIPNINAESVKNISVWHTKDTTEQAVIGNYFKNLDKLIETKEQEIEKLQNLKKACLVKMFPQNGSKVPEIRFKGFEGDWEEKKLGDCGHTFNGLSGKTKEDFGHGKGRYVTYMNVFQNPICNKKMLESIEIDNTQNPIQYGDVFFTTSSETPDEVGMSSVWLYDDKNVYLNSFCFGFRFKTPIEPHYLAYYFRANDFRSKMIFLAQGISRFNISKTKVMEIAILFPKDEKEQTTIGNYFRNLDKLIFTKEQEIEKLQNLKKACLDKMFV